MFKRNTLRIGLLGILLLSTLIFSMQTSPDAPTISKGLSPQVAFASRGAVYQPMVATLSTNKNVATIAFFPVTKVVFFRPSGIRGTLDTPADCWETSIAAPRANAWRCIVENRIYDPCFSTSMRAHYVICDADPSSHTRGLKIRLAHALPPSTVSSGTQAWMVRLIDGTVCSFATGATALFAGERLNYDCTNGSWLVGNPRTGVIWMVKELKKGQSRLVMTPIVEAWI